LKKALVVLAVIAVLAAGGAYLAYNSLDIIVKLALEHYGPEVAGVDVKVGEVRISPKEGRGAIRDIEIGNAPGFSAPRAAKLGHIGVSLDPNTLLEPEVLIRELVVEGPLITYERGRSTTNLEAIQRNIETYVKRAEAASPSGDRKASGASVHRKFIVEKLVIRGAKVTMTNAGLRGQGITFDLPDILMRDMGRREGGITASQAANMVTATLLSRIAQRILTSVDLLRRGGVEGAIDALKGLVR
jgi:hypothetical protein